jgi:hypothetical protein
MTLPPGAATRHVVEFGCSQVTSALSIRGRFSYGASSGNFQLPLQPSDFVRPVALDMGQFQTTWQDLEKRRSQRAAQGLRTSIKAFADFKDSLVATMNIRVVQVIGQEVVLAGAVLGDPANMCLVHGKFVGQTVDVIAVSTSAPFSQAIINQCSKAVA